MSEFKTLESNKSVRGKRSEIIYYIEDMDKLRDLTRDELKDVLHEVIKILTLPDIDKEDT